jgi:predicted DNA-binding transcriptional regulator AlpA
MTRKTRKATPKKKATPKRTRRNLASVGITDAVRNWDLLPSSALVGYDTLMGLFQMSESSIRRRIAAGKLPGPEELDGSMVRFMVGKVRKSVP